MRSVNANGLIDAIRNMIKDVVPMRYRSMEPHRRPNATKFTDDDILRAINEGMDQAQLVNKKNWSLVANWTITSDTDYPLPENFLNHQTISVQEEGSDTLSKISVYNAEQAPNYSTYAMLYNGFLRLTNGPSSGVLSMRYTCTSPRFETTESAIPINDIVKQYVTYSAAQTMLDMNPVAGLDFNNKIGFWNQQLELHGDQKNASVRFISHAEAIGFFDELDGHESGF